MAREAAGADKRRIARRALRTGVLIAGVAALAAFTLPSVFGLPLGLVFIYSFAGLAVISLIAWIVRIVRRPRFTVLPGTFIERIGIALVVVQLGFGVAALILLAALPAPCFGGRKSKQRCSMP